MTTAPVGDELWLGVDLGTQGVRAVLVDGRGAVQGTGASPLPSDVRQGDRHEQDPAQWWSALCTATRAALATAPGRAVGGVAVDSTSGTVVVQDPQGRPTGPGLMYDDARAVEQAPRAQEAGEAVWSRLGYRMQRSWALPKLLWLLEAGQVPAGHRVVHQADAVAALLTGGPVPTDTSHALKTGYDAVERRWPSEVLDALGVPDGVLPDVVLPGTDLGGVCRAAAELCGLPVGTPVRAGMTDGCAAQIAARALSPGSWSSALGTTLVIKGSTPDLLHDPSGSVYCHLNPDGGWLPGGASSTGAGVLNRDFDPARFDALTALAAQAGVPAGTTYPLLGEGERFPFVAPQARGFAEGVGTSPGERFAATLHGVALLERLAYDVLRALGADTAGPVTLSGGGSRNAYWNQLRADVLGRPALLPERVDAALGMAVCAAAPPGQLARTAGSMVRIRQELAPDRSRADQHDEAYDRFCGALVRRGWLDPATLPHAPQAPR